MIRSSTSFDVEGTSRVRGFTLLEATVALALFAAAGMALYSLFNTNLISLHRARDVAAHMPAAHRAIEHLSSIDPRREPSGRIELDGYDVAWSTRLLEPVRQNQTAQGFRGYHEVGLYEVEFEMRRRGRVAGTYKLRRLGYQQVRAPILD